MSLMAPRASAALVLVTLFLALSDALGAWAQAAVPRSTGAGLSLVRRRAFNCAWRRCRLRSDGIAGLR